MSTHEEFLTKLGLCTLTDENLCHNISEYINQEYKLEHAVQYSGSTTYFNFKDTDSITGIREFKFNIDKYNHRAVVSIDEEVIASINVRDYTNIDDIVKEISDIIIHNLRVERTPKSYIGTSSNSIDYMEIGYVIKEVWDKDNVSLSKNTELKTYLGEAFRSGMTVGYCEYEPGKYTDYIHYEIQNNNDEGSYLITTDDYDTFVGIVYADDYNTADNLARGIIKCVAEHYNNHLNDKLKIQIKAIEPETIKTDEREIRSVADICRIFDTYGQEHNESYLNNGYLLELDGYEYELEYGPKGSTEIKIPEFDFKTSFDIVTGDISVYPDNMYVPIEEYLTPIIVVNEKEFENTTALIEYILDGLYQFAEKVKNN